MKHTPTRYHSRPLQGSPVLSFFFFFQAEDGIRDLTVTGVQTCALPIYLLACFDAAISAQAAYVVELDLQGDEKPQAAVAIGVDAVKSTEELLVRRLGPLDRKSVV